MLKTGDGIIFGRVSVVADYPNKLNVETLDNLFLGRH